MEGIQKKESEGTDVSADVTAFLGAKSREKICETAREFAFPEQWALEKLLWAC